MQSTKQPTRKDNGKTGITAPREQPLAPLREQMEQAFDRVWRSFERSERDPWSLLRDIQFPSWPQIDATEDDKAVTLRVDLPGMDAKDVAVEVAGNQLTIRGSREEEREQRNGGKRYQHERYTGSFARTVTLPVSVDADRLEARYDKGVLTVTAPKAPGTQPKRVAVKTE